MFVVQPINFWISMAVSTTILSVISFAHYRDHFKKEYNYIREIIIGIASAVILYGVFYLGKIILDSSALIPNLEQNISGVYASKGIIPEWVIAILLFFPAGFGEEIFWRGYIQRKFSEKYGKMLALIITVFFYTTVHISTLNPVLMLAAFIAGIYWGLIFIWRGNIIAPLVSHMVWDPVIFIILPFN
ncbi:MAG: CPBP family intramembrane metalloprotease [Ignavibacteria bacterium]|nr:CPBP family intramembrane metalloprotease [Ignavibacteria bacterium]